MKVDKKNESCLKKRGFRIDELYSQIGFYFQMKKSLDILEIDG
jgi:hypothetical protein